MNATEGALGKARATRLNFSEFLRLSAETLKKAVFCAGE
jgi:hypothetical protein